MSENMSITLINQLESLIQDPKLTRDLQEETDNAIPVAWRLAEEGKFSEAVLMLFSLEKEARQGSDGPNCSRLGCTILAILNKYSDLKDVLQNLIILTRKRGQLKKCIIDLVQFCCSLLTDDLPKESKIQLLQTLRTVTDGKMFLEIEQARLIGKLSEIRENEGNIDEAALLVQDVQVESYGSMDKDEKIRYILNQMRLVLLRKEYVRCHIISKKLNSQMLEGREELSCQYHKYMIELYLHDEDYFNVHKSFEAVFNCIAEKGDVEQWKPVLSSSVMYLLLVRFNEQLKERLLHLARNEKKMQELPVLLNLVQSFLNPEIMVWPLKNLEEIKAQTIFSDSAVTGGDHRWEIFKKRITQNNLRVLGKYYSRIRLDRISELLGVSAEEVESEISELVCHDLMSAKIDRPSRLVEFERDDYGPETLRKWMSQVSKILKLVDETSHSIQKERMIQAARKKQSTKV